MKLHISLIQWYENGMAITVRQVVETPHLRTHFHSGRAGGQQVINWAHTCEMPDPWHWLEPFDMLMTNGLGMPTDPGEQVEYVSRLADAGISAIAVGENVGAPGISAEMYMASERRALPILLTAYEVPFAAVARVVADSRTDHEERSRLLKTARIYESLRTATIDRRDPNWLFDEIGAELGCRLEVLDMNAWRFAFAPRLTADAAIRQVLLDALDRCAGRLPAILRLEFRGRAALAVPVPSRRSAVLITSEFQESPGLTVLQHASTVAALELERLASERDSLSRSGHELLGDLLAQGVDSAQAIKRLGRFEMADRPLVVAAWRPPDPGCEPPGDSAGHIPPMDSRLSEDLFARGVPHLLRLGDQQSAGLALVPDSEVSLTTLLDLLSDDSPIGLSATVRDVEVLPRAAREARWALQAARTRRTRIIRYGEDEASSWTVPLEGSEELLEHVLGPLRDYDRMHQTELVRTLAVLLRNNRSPTPTAAELFIHRQTLVYRIRRIEELTSRSVSRTQDVVELWLALRAAEVVEGSTLLGAPGARPDD